jgi:hypothetical protein
MEVVDYNYLSECMFDALFFKNDFKTEITEPIRTKIETDLYPPVRNYIKPRCAV